MRYLTIVTALLLAAQSSSTTPVVVPVPTFKEVTGPGVMFAALQRFPIDEDLAHFKYIVKEYFVSGNAQGQPYTTRILVRRPADAKKFSGIVLAEPMHPTGNSWMSGSEPKMDTTYAATVAESSTSSTRIDFEPFMSVPARACRRDARMPLARKQP